MPGWSLLHHASKEGCVDSVMTLLSEGLSPVRRSHGSYWAPGVSPLELSVMNNHVAIFDMMKPEYVEPEMKSSLLCKASVAGREMLRTVLSSFSFDDEMLSDGLAKMLSVEREEKDFLLLLERMSCLDDADAHRSLLFFADRDMKEAFAAAACRSSLGAKGNVLHMLLCQENTTFSGMLLSLGVSAFAMTEMGVPAEDYPQMLSLAEMSSFKSQQEETGRAERASI